MKSKFPLQLVTLAMLPALIPLSLRMYTPSFLDITTTFSTTIQSIQYSLVIFFFILAFFEFSFKRQMLLFGEKAVLLGLSAFIVGSLLAACSTSLAIFYLARVFQAFGAACAAVNYRVKVTLLFDLEERVVAYSFIGILMSLIILPDAIISGLLTITVGWRGVFILATLIGCILLYLYWKYLYQKGSPYEASAYLKQKVTVNKRQVCMFLILAFQFSGFAVFIVGATDYFLRVHSLSPLHYGFLLLLVSLGYLLSSISIYLFSKLLNIKSSHFLIVGLFFSLIAAFSIYLLSNFYPYTSVVWYFFFMMCYQVGTRFINLSGNFFLVTRNNATKASSCLGSIKYFFAGVISLISITITTELSEVCFIILLCSISSCLLFFVLYSWKNIYMIFSWRKYRNKEASLLIF
jgi:MFS transporter, DHA1 family, multidrug resistance protein